MQGMLKSTGLQLILIVNNHHRRLVVAIVSESSHHRLLHFKTRSENSTGGFSTA